MKKAKLVSMNGVSLDSGERIYFINDVGKVSSKKYQIRRLSEKIRNRIRKFTYGWTAEKITIEPPPLNAIEFMEIYDRHSWKVNEGSDYLLGVEERLEIESRVFQRIWTEHRRVRSEGELEHWIINLAAEEISGRVKELIETEQELPEILLFRVFPELWSGVQITYRAASVPLMEEERPIISHQRSQR